VTLLESICLNRNLPSNFNDLIVWQAEEVADMDGVALHDSKEPFLPCGKAFAVLAADHRLMAHVIRHVADVDRASQRSAGRQQFRDMRTLLLRYWVLLGHLSNSEFVL